jgi:outer membrane lipoprotein SlyB
VTQRLLAVSVGFALLSGCATTSQTQWTPTVDTYGSSRAQYLSRDTEECRSLAMRASGSISEQTTQGVVSGGLIGAAGGAAIGGILGGSRSSLGRGAALGAVTGAMAGGAGSSAQTEADFQRAFRNCLRQRGHNVIN